jgi:TetR/AcrR family transcriptional regulator, transcriptional repressor for nem operon
MNQDFNQTRVISGVMELFWNKGYEATTIEDILKVTQLNRKKFNEFFGSKEQLYLETFNYYSF